MFKIDKIVKFHGGFGKIAVLVSIIFLLVSSGCSLKKPYVGLQVNTNDWVKYSSGEKINFETDAADFELTITKTEEEGEYLLEGIMDGSDGSLKSIHHLVIRECRFSLILAKDNVVVDNVSFFPQGTDHTHKLPYKKKFKTVSFDSVTITYEMSVRG